MEATPSQSDRRFLPLLLKGYILGTLGGAVVLHVAIALIAPGDGGTASALASAPILFTILILLGFVGLVVFPAAALASWPFRRLVFEHPLRAASLVVAVGIGVGALLTSTIFQIGPGDFWSGPLVGLVYGVVWFWVVWSSVEAQSDGAGA